MYHVASVGSLTIYAHLIGNHSNESFDVELSWTPLLTGGVRALQTPERFPKGSPLTESRVFYIIEIVQQCNA